MDFFESDPQKLCQQRIDHAFSRDPTVKFMVEKMEQVCSISLFDNILAIGPYEGIETNPFSA